MKSLFLNEKFILSIVVLNALVIYLQECDFAWSWLAVVDVVCSLIFLVEMVIKHNEYGFNGYWSQGWNKLDGTLVILSIPSIVVFFTGIEMVDVSVLLALRLMRVLRFFRVMHFFPGFSRVIDGFKQAMSQSWAVLLSFFVIIVVFGLINCSLFKDIAPEYFGNPLTSIFSVFQLCTIEGWYDIPNTVAEATGSVVLGRCVSVYFCLLLIMGGIIGMSFINSVFVDAMVSDNNDDVEKKLDDMKVEIAELKELVKSLKSEAKE